ncbi:MAG: energy transducer TonB [Deltaproteobacteria bacterium]|nr:energy transducer TonB [Deltaproteobacteria bacterium]
MKLPAAALALFTVGCRSGAAASSDTPHPGAQFLRLAIVAALAGVVCAACRGRTDDAQVNHPDDAGQAADARVAVDRHGDVGGEEGNGHGHGSGVANGPRVGSGPVVRSGHFAIWGPLNAEVVRRIVHRHTGYRGTVRRCYERGLDRNRSLGGEVTIKFMIDPTGSVTSAEAVASTLGDSDVEGCIVRAFERMEFPEPLRGETVIVSFPIVFAPPPDSP